MGNVKWLARALRKTEDANTVDMRQFTPLPAGGYLVGGALRDALLERPFADLDWLVADPEETARAVALELSGSAFPLDEARGHWRVVTNGEAGSVTRDYIRLEGGLEVNLHERDFTVNAMAADTEGRLTDPLNGRADLEKRILRMVSRDNLFADPLRALRGVRLAAGLGFGLEPRTSAAVRELAEAQRSGDVPLPAWERVGEELNRLLMSKGAARGLGLLAELKLLDVYLPELAAARGVEQGGFHHLDVLGHSLEALRQLTLGFPDADLTLRWATLLHDVGKPETKSFGESGRFYHFYGHDKVGSDLTRAVLRRLRQPNGTVHKAEGLVRYHMLPPPKNRKEAKRFVHRRRELLPDLLKLMIADREAARGPQSSEASRRGYKLAFARVLEILSEPPPPKPLLDGREVMALLKLPPGSQVGEAVRFLKEAEAVGDVRTRDEAAEALKRFARRQGWSA